MVGLLLIRNFTQRNIPHFSYTHIARAVLPGWELSLAFVGKTRARSLNRSLRAKEYVPNVLSYATGTSAGEIIICLDEAIQQAPHHAMDSRRFVGYLFIHGLLHLKGYRHGGTMEQCERTLLDRFASRGTRPTTHVTTHRNRNRYRHVPSKAGRG